MPYGKGTYGSKRGRPSSSLKGKQKNLPDALKSKILASDGASIKKPRGTKEEKAQMRVSKRNEKVSKRIHKFSEKASKKADKAIAKAKAGKITGALADQKINKAFDKNMNKARLTYGSKKDAKSIVKKKK